MTRYTRKDDPYSSHGRIPELVRRLSPVGRVLDVGCDEGLAARDLVEYGFEIVGIDRNAAALERVGAHYQQTILADLEKELPAVEGQFDVIVFADILEHLARPEAVFRHFTRSLR